VILAHAARNIAESAFPKNFEFAKDESAFADSAHAGVLPLLKLASTSESA
jgi:hypothetical protein